MLDVLHCPARAVELVMRLPSLVGAVFPALSPAKHVRSMSRTPDRTMDDYLREVRRLFEAPLQPSNLHAMSGKLQAQFEEKLKGPGICMLPSWNHTLPTGRERGSYLALDVGGSTLRVALVELRGREVEEGEPMRITKMRSFRIDDAVRALKGRAFFDWMADRIGELVAEFDFQEHFGKSTMPMGLAWSFPVEQTSTRNFLLLDMGKHFCADEGLLRQDLGSLVNEACAKKNLNVRLETIINDASATLMSRAYLDSTTHIALIAGTGTNAAIHLPVSAFARSKFGQRPQSWFDRAQHVLVNTELSLFGKGVLPMTRWDDYLNNTHKLPNFQPIEHLIGGRYLGEIIRLVCVEAIQTAGLFGGRIPDRFLEAYALDTSTIAAIQNDDSPFLTRAISYFQTAHPLPSPGTPSHADLLFVQQVSKIVSQRAAALLAGCIHALWSLRTRSEGLDPASAGPLKIGCNGSVIEKYPSFREKCQECLDELTALSGAAPHSVELQCAFDSAIFGAAVAACCLEGEET